MLISLHIKNIALVSDFTIEFTGGLNVLTGETGAGKSIIIDSLSFVLGERADKTLIRHGENAASVEAVFSARTAAVFDFFEEYGIEPDDTVIIRRVMTADGKNECRVNGRLVTLGTLKILTAVLADIYGQHEHQSLLNVKKHLEILDGLYPERLDALKYKTRELFIEADSVVKELAKYGDAALREQRMDTLKFQLAEIESAGLIIGEDDSLTEKRRRLNNIGKLTTGAASAYEMLGGVHGAAEGIRGALAALSPLLGTDKELDAVYDRLDAAGSELNDINYDIKSYLNTLEYDEGEADRVERRLDIIKLLKKKYGPTIEAVLDFAVKAGEQFYTLQNSADKISVLEERMAGLRREYAAAAAALSKARKECARDFEEEIRSGLNDLSMKGTTFGVEFTETEGTAGGVDSAEFYMSANTGEPLKPLVKVISGGEMSRFMLALKSIISKADGIDTMVFDEIDSGISGNVAQVVADKLYNISVGRQVLAVTHLPQLASMADSHYLINKYVKDAKTITEVRLLNEESSINELAIIIGGESSSVYALLHAREMKANARKRKDIYAI